MLTQVRQSGLQANTVRVCSLVRDPSMQSPGQVLIHPLSKQLSGLQPQIRSMRSFPRHIMQLQGVRPCGHLKLDLALYKIEYIIIIHVF